MEIRTIFAVALTMLAAMPVFGAETLHLTCDGTRKLTCSAWKRY